MLSDHVARLFEGDRVRLADVAEAMFPTDERGRLVGRAPHFHAVRSPDDLDFRFHADLDGDVVESIESIIVRPRGRPSEWEGDYAQIVARLSTVAPLRSMRSGLLYAVPGDIEFPDPAVLVDGHNATLLLGGLDEWHPDALEGAPMAVSVAGGRAVSVCASVRSSVKVHLAGVETSASCRGQGHAARAVAAWARAVTTAGAAPFYATTFDNTSSQRLASRLGLHLIGSEFSVACEAGQR